MHNRKPNQDCKPSRAATQEEKRLIAKYLCYEQFGEGVDSPEYSGILKAVQDATIVVFSEFYDDGDHQVWVAWSDDYPYLPNHYEHFKMLISDDFNAIKRVHIKSRRKYHRVD